MTGSSPVVAVTVDRARYRRYDTVVATVTVTDPDSRVETMTAAGVGPAGETIRIDQTVTHMDTARIVWRWRGTTDVLGMGPTLRRLAPVTSSTLEAVVTDAQGHEVVTAVDVTVQGLLLGVDVDTSQTPAFWLSELTQVIAGRNPTGPTKLFQTAGLPVVGKYAVPSGMIPHYTFAQMPTEAAFRPWVAGVTGPAWVTPVQEIDRKMTLADAATMYARVMSWMVDSAPPGVDLVPNITASWQESPDPAKGQGKQWSAWAAAFAAVGVKMLGVDMYVGGQSAYRPITAQLDPAAAAAQVAGLDLVVPEFGVVVPLGATATNLDERAAWIAAALAAFEQHGTLAAAWWNAPPSAQRGVFRLAQDDPGWDALRAGLPA